MKNIFKNFIKRKKIEIDNQLEESDVNKSEVTTNYATIQLPELKYAKNKKPSDYISKDFYETIEKGRSYYKQKQYLKSMDEFLKVYNLEYKADSYFTHLIRAYRKTIEQLINEEKYINVIEIFEDLFEKCPNYTITDLKNFNKIAKLINNSEKGEYVPYKELKVNAIENFTLDSEQITFITDSKKPRGFTISKSNATTYSQLMNFTEFITHEISYIDFNNGMLEYKQNLREKEVSYSPYRFKETSDNKYFITSTKELNLFLFNWNLDKLDSFNISQYSSSYSNLRCIDIALDLSLYLITSIDKAFLFDNSFKHITTWEAPHNEGFEKKKIESSKAVTSNIEDSLQTLGLRGKPNQDEIKKSFRELLLKHHPDRNQDDPKAVDTTRELIQAYELLSGEEAQNAFDGVDQDEYYWVDTKNIKKFDIYGVRFEISFSSGSGEDWIYGSGISDDGSRIYLGCYSGKVYQINKLGNLQKIYIIPEDKTGVYGSTNPVSSIKEFKGYLYILTSWYLYILKSDKVIKYIYSKDGIIKWFEDGLILQRKKKFTVFDLEGNNLGEICFKQKIDHISYKNRYFIVTTLSKTYCFKWNEKHSKISN